MENLRPMTNKERGNLFGTKRFRVPKDRRCARCKSVKTAISKLGVPKWFKRKDGYICSKCSSIERYRETRGKQRDIYEDYYNVCLLNSTDIYFINGDKTDMRIENLRAVPHGYNAKMVNTIDTTGAYCYCCGSPSSFGHWKKTEYGFRCKFCQMDAERRDVKRTKGYDEYVDLAKRARKLFHDPNYIPPQSKICAVCGSTETSRKGDSNDVSPRRYRLDTIKKETGIWRKLQKGEQVKCANCYDRQEKTKRVPTANFIRVWQVALKNSKMFPLRSDHVQKPVFRGIQNPSLPRYNHKLKSPRHCIMCRSYTTSKNDKGIDQWYRIKAPIGPVGYLDEKCYRRRELNKRRKRKPGWMRRGHRN